MGCGPRGQHARSVTCAQGDTSAAISRAALLCAALPCPGALPPPLLQPICAQELAQDFPRLVEGLSHQRFGKSLRQAVEGFQRMLPPSSELLLVNGLLVQAGQQGGNLYDLLDTLRREVGVRLAAAGRGAAALVWRSCERAVR